MAKTRYKPEELTQQGEPAVAILPSEQPVSPFLDPSVAQAEPQGSELYNLGTVQQRAESTRDADMYMPSYLQAARNYPTGAEGSATRPEGASPMLYPSQAETQPRVRARYKPEEALAIAEANRPKRYSPDQMLDIAAESMFDASQPPLPKDLWKAATQRRSEMVKDGRLPMEFGQIDSLKDGIVWGANALYGAGSYLISAPIAAATSYAASPIESQRQMHATAAATIKRLSTEFGLQTYQDIFNLTHEPKYRVKETGQFVAVNKTGLPLMLPAASGGNNVISGDGIINPVAPEAGMRQFAKEGMTLVPTNEQDLEDYRYGQYLDRMGVGAQSIEDMKAKAPPELLAALASGNWDSVEPNQAQTELALLAAQAAIPIGGSARTWGVGRRVAAGISKAAEKVEAIAGFPVDVDTALRAKFVKAVTSGTGADAVAQKTAMQAAIDAGKTTAKVGGVYGVAAGVSSFEGTPSEIKDLAWTAANLYSGYKGGMYVARQLRSASGFTKTVLKEVADPSRGLDAGARAAVAANPAVPQSVREVLESPSRYRAMESTPARLAKNPELSPTSRAVFDKLSDYRFVQTARLARDTAAGVPKGITLNAPFIAGALASDDPERAGQMIAAGGLFGAVGGAASRFTEANMRRGEEANSDIARMLVDIQAGNELGSGLGGEIMRNRLRPGTRFQDGERGFVMPEQEVASFLTEMEMAGADVAAFVQGKSFDELAQWAAYQGFFRDKVDLVPLNARDYKLNAEAAGQNGSGAYFLQPSENRRARIFVNAESRRSGLAPHEYGHAVLRGGALSPDQIDAVHAEINGRYTPDALKAMAGEYAAGMVRADNAKAGINIEPSPAAITAKVNELSQGSMIKGSADGLDWLREEIFAEEFRNANIDMNRARRNIPLGANPVSFVENLLGAQSRALHMAGIDIDPQTGKPMGRDQIFKENRVAAGDPVVMKNYEDYVKQWRRWINDPTHEVDPGVPLSKTGNPQDTANSPNVTWKDYGRRGVVETEFAVKNPDGSVTPKDWKRDIKPTVRARQQAVREMSNRSKEVAAADDQTFGMRKRNDGRREISGRRLPDSFFFIPQYKPFHTILRKINAADNAGETLQVRFFAKGKSKDVFKDGIRNTNAVNREALHGNFVAKKDGTLMWGWLDMTQFRNRAMKAIADRNPALSEYDWNLKAIMDDLPVHLTDQRRGKGGAFSVGPKRANILNGLIGIGDGPLVGAFGKGTAYKTIHLDSIDAIVPTGKTGGEFDVYRANRNAMPDDPKPAVDMETDVDNNRMPQQIPRGAQGMPDVGYGERADIPLNERARRAAFVGADGRVVSTNKRTHFETNEDLGPDFLAIGAGSISEDGFFRFGSDTMDNPMGETPSQSRAAAARHNREVYDSGRRPSELLEDPPGLEKMAARGQAMPDTGDAPQPRRYVSMEKFIEEAGDELSEVLPNAYKNLEFNDDNYPTHLVSFSDARNSMYRSRVPSKEFFDWLHSDKVMDGLVFDKEYTPARPGEGASHTRESYQALIDRLRDISLRKPKSSAAPRGQAMPDSLKSIPTDQLQRQYEENQGYLGLSTLGMREGRPVRGGAAQTRELLRRNEAISAELLRRGVREEDPQLQRALQRRGQAMPDAAAQNLEQSAVESFQWMRNKEGGQAYGNQQVTVPLTEQIFQSEMLPRMRAGYANTLAEYQAKHPEATHASFVKVAGEGPWKFNGDGELEALRPNPPNRGWAMPVDSFKSRAAKSQGKTADSEAFPAPRGQAMPDVSPVLSAGDADTLPVVQKLNDKGKPAMKDGKPEAASIGYDLLRAPGIVDYVGNKAEDLTKPDYDGLDYDVGPQLRKEIDAAIDSGAVDSAANRTAEFAREQMQNPEIAAGKGWYSRMREKLLSAVGEQGRELLSQLLGATSAKTPVDQNFLQAMDAYEGILAGRYEKHRQGYLEMKALESEGKLVPTILERGYVDVLRERANKLSRGAARLPRKADRTAAKSEANALRKLVNKAPEKWDPSEARAIMIEATGILPMRSNGKKFNANSRAVLKVIADDWKINRQAPKTPNFAGNLSGRTVQATIDVWAARHLRELLYKGSGKPWRIQPKSEVGVTNHDFALGQIIMQRAAKKLDMNPDDLQAILWFAEKHKWDAKGWTDNAGAEKSSFDTVANLFFPEGKKPLSFDEASKMYNDMKAAEKAAKKAQDKAVKAAAAKL